MTVHHHPVQFTPGEGDEVVVNIPNVRIKLIKNTKGFNWEISVAGDTGQEVLDRTKRINAEMQRQYGSTV